MNSHLVRTGNVISLEQQQVLCKPISLSEIKDALWSIGGDKAPGPNGYSSHFYKDNWELVKDDVEEAVKIFLSSGKMLKQVNATTITLIPKCNPPKKVTDFRQIACCNTLYKCVSKVLSNRLKMVLPHIIDEAQCAFVENRDIIQNILLCQ